MKTRLLKKIRKRYKIVHFPNGCFNNLFCEHHDYNLYQLVDTKTANELDSIKMTVQLKRKNADSQYVEDELIFNTEKECVDRLKSEIIRLLIKEGHRNTKIKKK